MFLEGKVWKDKGYWLAEVAALDILTQGRSRKDAFAMVIDAIRLLLDRKGSRIKILPYSENCFLVESSAQKELLALMLKRQRAKHRLTVAQMAERLGTKSKNAYAQYEQGKSQPSFSKVQEFLTAMDPKAVLAFTVCEKSEP